MAEIATSKEADNQQFQSQQPNELVWFSHLEKEYQVVDIGFKKLFQWKETEPPKIWDWDNCTVSRAKVLSNGKVRIVIRSKTNRNSDYMGRIPVELRYMLGIDIASISEPYSEPYDLASSKRQKLPVSAKKKINYERWACKLDEKYWIWQWAMKDTDIKSSQVYHLYEDIKGFLEEAQSMRRRSSNSDQITSGSNDGIFRVHLDERVKADDIVPVIYQPAIDSLKNFLREVHCAKLVGHDSSVDVEVSLLFNDEELRRHRYLNEIYSKIREILYGRTKDIETFKIHLTKNKGDESQKGITDDNMMNEEANIHSENKEINKNKRNSSNYFIFEGIYSGQYDIEYDTIHLDKPPPPKRNIVYYFLDHYHPIIFINTANHAMSEHDNNHDIWKWEYIPWVKKAPIKLGSKSRKDIELQFTPFIRRILKIAS
jgi:hypothetical protein